MSVVVLVAVATAKTEVVLFVSLALMGVLSVMVLICAMPRQTSRRSTDSYVATLRSIPILFLRDRVLSVRGVLPLLVGIVLLDLAVQAAHVTNQSMILNSYPPEASSRLVGGYMMFYSIGSAIGAISSTTVYAHAGWTGVSVAGASFSAIALIFWKVTLRLPTGGSHVSDERSILGTKGSWESSREPCSD